ncbi:hypothetical protein ABEB36_004911 [Hypothenemus hampei]|uniref:Pseudouridine synthase I TruA alpha/beta domain-containing protein n=1 Tax=Hypothenemus hampei TaxID=57062 RepID=A0ABD1EWR1_HYPHA
MDCVVKIKKPNKTSTVNDLELLTKEQLIRKIQVLEAHNIQLQNIINKSKSSQPSSKKENKIYDFSKCRFRHILLRILYFGWNYQGFAVQEDTTNTIEHHLFEALTKTCLIKDRSSSNYHRCGRTDKGVSSFGQVLSIDVRTKLSESDQDDLEKEINYCKVLNRVLPDDIRCVAWSPCNEGFSARFDCRSRTYKYYFPRGKLNIDKMREAGKFLIGTHDFRNFVKMDVGNGVVQFTRNIFNFEIKSYSDNDSEYSLYVAIINANAFLWHQIRYIIGLLFLIGANKEDPTIIKELLDIEKNPRKPDYSMSSEVPLTLFYCDYENVNWQLDEDNMKCLIEKLQQMWTYSVTK